MNNVLTRTLEMLLRVRDYGSQHATSFAADSLAAEQFAVVAEAVEALTEAGRSQTTGLSSVQQATASRTEAREALRESMQAITRTARVMALDITGLENKFRLPRSGSDQALLIAASAFATDARPLKAEFIRHEMDASFIEDMEAEIDALQHAISTQNTGRGAHVSATISLDAQTERGLIAARKLHAILRNKFRDDPPALAAWESARHVERVARQRKHANGGATAPVPGGDKRS